MPTTVLIRAKHMRSVQHEVNSIDFDSMHKYGHQSRIEQLHLILIPSYANKEKLINYTPIKLFSVSFYEIIRLLEHNIATVRTSPIETLHIVTIALENNNNNKWLITHHAHTYELRIPCISR